MNLFIIDVV